MVEAPSPPYIPAKYHGGSQSPLKRIVLHSTVSETYCGAARDIASYFQDPTYVSSAHYAVDPCETVQMVYDHTIAWHDGTNVNSLGIEMCEIPSHDVSRWETEEHQKLLSNTSDLVRQLCLAYGIPMRKLDAAQIRAGEWGICGHDDMAAAYPENTSHWDPGAFPWTEFITQVNGDDVSYQDAYNAVRDFFWQDVHRSRVPGSEVEFSLGDSILDSNRFDYENWVALKEGREFDYTRIEEAVSQAVSEAVGPQFSDAVLEGMAARLAE